MVRATLERSRRVSLRVELCAPASVRVGRCGVRVAPCLTLSVGLRLAAASSASRSQLPAPPPVRLSATADSRHGRQHPPGRTEVSSGCVASDSEADEHWQLEYLAVTCQCAGCLKDHDGSGVCGSDSDGGVTVIGGAGVHSHRQRLRSPVPGPTWKPVQVPSELPQSAHHDLRLSTPGPSPVGSTLRAAG
jgi:hypothetical protein